MCPLQGLPNLNGDKPQPRGVQGGEGKAREGREGSDKIQEEHFIPLAHSLTLSSTGRAACSYSTVKMALLLPHSGEPQPTHPPSLLPPSLAPTRLLIPPLPSFPINSLRFLLSSLCYTFNTPPPSCLFLRPSHHAPPPLTLFPQSDLEYAFPHLFKDSLICTPSSPHIPLVFILLLFYSNTKWASVKQTEIRKWKKIVVKLLKLILGEVKCVFPVATLAYKWSILYLIITTKAYKKYSTQSVNWVN